MLSGGSSSRAVVATCRADWLREPRCPGKHRVVLVASGSVAAVKVPELAVALCSSQVACEVVLVLTDSAEAMCSNAAGKYCPKALIEEMSQLESSGRLRVLRDADEWNSYEDVSSDAVVHIELRKWADALLVAPCTANTLAKVALGLCDNLATSLLRAWDPEKPLVLAPAMNVVMWEHPTTAQHLRTLESWGYRIVPPVCKRLACGDVGRGALAPVTQVVEAVQAALDAARATGATEQQTPVGGCSKSAWKRLGFEEWAPREGEIS